MATVLVSLRRQTETNALLTELDESMNRKEQLVDADRQLITDAEDLMRQIEEASSEKS